MTRLEKTLAAIDALHAQDPEQENGKAKELIYAENMSGWLQKLNPNASDELQIAVRSQHLCRWEIARSEFPMDRPGYLKWRTELGKLHARKATEVMATEGFSEESYKQVESTVRKLGIKRNADAQTLEDCACLVFIETGFLPFAVKHSEEKIISIVQKTWAKMSKQAQQEALKLNLPEEALTVIQKALA
ncbi:DUF4202 domain-containing protein [Endozoicomonas sp. OPT23]|uniref:DUF4202 domain-containing protein n=1 Tax=Endozoicomonas sp. OPT23 TaxID=2072845 RepID=UPI00129A8075|nr:DUF4202 domain-containing protein [Endozoicomonas sp. OPT23]MRI33541.1 DUF4202 domain-containing protein [Endozoicomonas sp. OPT23]